MAGAIGFKVKFKFKNKKVRKLAKSASERNLFRAGGLIATIAKRSLRKGKQSSLPGKPPKWRTSQIIFVPEGPLKRSVSKKRASELEAMGIKIKKINITIARGGFLRKSITFEVIKNKQNTIVGPTFSGARRIGKLHEFGGRGIEGRGRNKRITGRYPPRPFMRQALIKASQNEKIAKFWRDSIRAI